MIKLNHYGERSFSYAASVECYKLDVEIKSLINLETLKKLLKYIDLILHVHKFACHILYTVHISTLHLWYSSEYLLNIFIYLCQKF